MGGGGEAPRVAHPPGFRSLLLHFSGLHLFERVICYTTLLLLIDTTSYSSGMKHNDNGVG